MYLNQDSIQELQWWFNNLESCNDKLIVSETFKKVMQSDASKKGWGILSESVNMGSMDTLQEPNLHIKVLELLAIKLALLIF